MTHIISATKERCPLWCKSNVCPLYSYVIIVKERSNYIATRITYNAGAV